MYVHTSNMIRRFSKIITRITFEYLIKSSNEFLLYFKILAVIIIIEPSCSWQLQLTSWETWHGLDIVRNYLKERRYTKKNEGISILCFEVLEQKIESFLKVLFSLFRWTSIFCFETFFVSLTFLACLDLKWRHLVYIQ